MCLQVLIRVKPGMRASSEQIIYQVRAEFAVSVSIMMGKMDFASDVRGSFYTGYEHGSMAAYHYYCRHFLSSYKTSTIEPSADSYRLEQ